MPRRPDMGSGFIEGGGPPPVLLDGEPLPDEMGVPPELLERAQIIEGDDGAISVELMPEEEAQEPVAHDANLAEFIDEGALSRLAGELDEAIEADKRSRSPWEDALTKGMTLLGLNIDERTTPFKGASGVFDSTMLDAAIRWQAQARGEFLPNDGPVKTKIVGAETEELSAQAERVQAFMNLYLTRGAPEYYPDRDQMFFWLPIAGSMFAKVYNDPVLGRPSLPYIHPSKLIVNYNATDMKTATRVTNLIDTSKRDLMLRQEVGFWRNVDLGRPTMEQTRSPVQQKQDKIDGKTPSTYEGDYEYRLAEVHAYIDLDAYLSGDVARDLSTEGGLPLPFIVTFDRDTKKTLSIRRNWKEEDGRRDKRHYFVHHKFLPGFGFYGLGYAHVLGSPATSLTAILRQAVDAGTLRQFPGGLRVKGMRVEENNLTIGPLEFKEIDIGAMPRIQDAIMMLPYEGADPNLIQLRKEIKEDAQRLANTAEIAVGEGRQDAPVGTTVALLEAATKPQSGIFKRVHDSMSDEFTLLGAIFGDVLPDEPYPFPVVGGESAIMRTDFDDRIDIIPVSDPNVSSSAQRMMRAEAELRMAQSAPEQHNVTVAFKQMYRAMGKSEQEIAALVKEPPPPADPSDPLTENVLAMKGQPLTVGPEQDDDAHIIVHQELMALPPQPSASPTAPPMPNPATLAGQLHIAEHKASKARKTALRMMGIPPLSIPPGIPLPPVIENAVAMVAAEMAQIDRQQANAQMAEANAGMAQAMQMEAQAKFAAIQGKLKEATIKAEVERFKATLASKDKQRQNETKLQLATIKAVADMSKPPPKPTVPGIGRA